MDPTGEDSNTPPVIGTPGQAELVRIPSSAPVSAANPSVGRVSVSPGLRRGFVVIAVLLFLFVLTIVAITGYFRLSSETVALRKSAMAALPGAWDKRVGVKIGWFTTTAIRTGSRFFDLAPEPRAALDALRAVDVGVYKLQEDPEPEAIRTLLASSDRTMKRRGWERVIGVSREGALVGVYIPHRKASHREMRCCVLVLKGRDLVVASASGNLEPLFELAGEKARGTCRSYGVSGLGNFISSRASNQNAAGAK